MVEMTAANSEAARAKATAAKAKAVAAAALVAVRILQAAPCRGLKQRAETASHVTLYSCLRTTNQTQ